MIFLSSSVSCNDQKTTDKISSAVEITDTDKTLLSEIDLNKSFLENVELKKYKFEKGYIEDIKLSSLESKLFRMQLFKFLEDKNFEGGEYEQVFFIKLLLIRIQQTNDLSSYLYLSEIYDNPTLGYFLEDYELNLYQLFLDKPNFFIQAALLYKQQKLLDYINQNLPKVYVRNEKYFDDNVVEINFNGNMLLVENETVKSFYLKELKQKITDNSEVIEAFFSPTLETGWQDKTVLYFNIYQYLESAATKGLDKEELEFYMKNYKPFFKNYVIKEDSSFTIVDPDGYTNLRKDTNSTSEVLQRIKSGENINVLDNSGDWFLVKTKEGKEGYIHKSRIKSK